LLGAALHSLRSGNYKSENLAPPPPDVVLHSQRYHKQPVN
jgi:hypothetical protein